MLGRWLGEWLGRWLGHTSTAPKPAHPQEAVQVTLRQHEAAVIPREVPVAVLISASVEGITLRALAAETCTVGAGAEDIYTPEATEPVIRAPTPPENASSAGVEAEELIVPSAPEALVWHTQFAEPVQFAEEVELVVIEGTAEAVLVSTYALHEALISV